LYFSAAASSMAALKQPTIKVVAIIAEGVPESDTKQLIAYARANNKVGYNTKLTHSSWCSIPRNLLLIDLFLLMWAFRVNLLLLIGHYRLLLDQLLLEAFKLEPLKLVTQLELLTISSNASCTGLDLLALSQNLYELWRLFFSHFVVYLSSWLSSFES